MIYEQSMIPLQAAARPFLSTEGEVGAPGNGELGIAWIPIAIGSSLLLGGGTLWEFRQRRGAVQDYRECVEKFSSAPYNEPAEIAAQICSGEVSPKGFKWGLNAGTIILVAGSIFGMWFATQLMISAAKSKLEGG